MASKLIDTDLWLRVKPALEALNRKFDEHQRSGKWVPSSRVPTLSYFDSGWPNVTEQLLGSDGKPNYSQLFGSAVQITTPYSYDDVSELGDLIAYVLGRPDLAKALRIRPDDTTPIDEAESQMMRYQAADLALSVVDRAWSLGGVDDDLLASVYMEREASWLLPKLPVELVVPLVMTSFDLLDPFVVDENVTIEKLDEPFILASARTGYTLEAVPTVVSNAATHAVVISGLEVDNSSHGARVWRGEGRAVDLSRVDEIIEAVRIVSGASTGYAQVLFRPRGWADRWHYNLPAVDRLGAFRRYPASFDNYGWLRPGEKINNAQVGSLPSIVKSIRGADKATKLAVRRLSLATLRDDMDDKLVDACIGIEALLSNDSIEISHKIATRGAVVLAVKSDVPMDASLAFGMLKAVYARRSELVHGATKGKKVEFEVPGVGRTETWRIAVFLLRKILLSKFSAPGSWTIAELDEIVLNALTRFEQLDSGNEAEGVS